MLVRLAVLCNIAVSIPKAAGRTRTSDLFVISEKRIIAVLIPNRIALIKLYQLSYHGIIIRKIRVFPGLFPLYPNQPIYVGSGLRLAA